MFFNSKVFWDYVTKYVYSGFMCQFHNHLFDILSRLFRNIRQSRLSQEQYFLPEFQADDVILLYKREMERILRCNLSRDKISLSKEDVRFASSSRMRWSIQVLTLHLLSKRFGVYSYNRGSFHPLEFIYTMKPSKLQIKINPNNLPGMKDQNRVDDIIQDVLINHRHIPLIFKTVKLQVSCY